MLRLLFGVMGCLSLYLSNGFAYTVLLFIYNVI